MDKIKLFLLEQKLSPNLKGFDYLAEALKLMLQDNSYKFNVHKKLYVVLAKKFKVTTQCVERNIRTVVEKAKLGLTNTQFLAQAILILEK